MPRPPAFQCRQLYSGCPVTRGNRTGVNQLELHMKVYVRPLSRKTKLFRIGTGRLTGRIAPKRRTTDTWPSYFQVDGQGGPPTCLHMYPKLLTMRGPWPTVTCLLNS